VIIIVIVIKAKQSNFPTLVPCLNYVNMYHKKR